MKKIFKDYLSSKNWLIHEKGWNKANIGVSESKFTLGNGFLGSRGILEEVTYEATPGTYIAGVFDKSTSMVEELVNLPNPINFRVMVDGEKLDVGAMDVLNHERILDMKKAILFRDTLLMDRHKNKISFSSMRFLSMFDKGLGVMRIFITPLDAKSELVIHTEIDTAVTNRGVLTEGEKKHFTITEITQTYTQEKSYLSIETFDKKLPIAFASSLEVIKDAKKKSRYYAKNKSFKLTLKKGQTACFTKYFYINNKQSSDLKRETLSLLNKNIKLGFEKILNLHIKRWKKLWHISNIELKGDAEVEKALRFNLFHLIICGNEENQDASIGARTLSGEGYRGHVFWDTEIFMLPFFIYTNPRAARNLLMYRYNRLNAARQIARDRGYKGAMFPWESASSGFDVTPTWHKDFDGKIIKIRTNEFEHHITADVAYAVWHYYNLTHDIAFFLKYGLEIIFECARFWASRVEYKKRTDSYHINGVIGPDEFHENVDDNAYTNALAKWNLFRATDLYKRFKKEYPQDLQLISQEISLSAEEVKTWNSIAARISVISNPKTKVIEEFKGYFKKKYVKITDFTDDFMPIVPKSVSFRKIADTQLVKQADVLMLLYVLSSFYSLSKKKVNYKYYNPRTVHKSSLSPSMHAIIANEVGDTQRAYQYLLATVFTDLRNVHGNTAEGIHAASLGGLWQAMVNGFGGVRVNKGILSLEPKLPVEWKELSFNMFFRKFQLRFSIMKNKVKVKALSTKKNDQIMISVFGKRKKLKVNKIYYFKRGGR